MSVRTSRELVRAARSSRVSSVVGFLCALLAARCQVGRQSSSQGTRDQVSLMSLGPRRLAGCVERRTTPACLLSVFRIREVKFGTVSQPAPFSQITLSRRPSTRQRGPSFGSPQCILPALARAGSDVINHPFRWPCSETGLCANVP